MEEKKLTDNTEINVGMTDEEIVKALDKTKQELANISPEDDDYDKLLTVKTIVDYCYDLIYRLQDDNKNYDRANSELTCTIAEQKAEIERLTEENGQLKGYNSGLEYKNAELQKQVNELKEKLWKSKQDMMTYHSKTVSEAVKDTAKEILIPLIDCEKQIDPLKTGIRWSVLKGFCKKFDVEVE